MGNGIFTHVGGAERVAIDIRGDKVDIIRKVSDKTRQATLGRFVRRAVGGRVILEHPRADGRIRQRSGLQLHRHRARYRHGEMSAVELVAVGNHRDQVTAIGQVVQSGNEIVLVAFSIDRAEAAVLNACRNPVTGAWVAGTSRRTTVSRTALFGCACIVLIDNIFELSDLD